MNASHVGLLAVAMLVVMPVRPAASDSCREEDLDAQGKCPKPPSPPPPPPKNGERKLVQVKLQQPPPLPKVSCPEGMVRVPAGTFQMGSPEQGNWEAGYPQHEVKLSGYCIDRTEVTVKFYEGCAAAKGCSARSASSTCNQADRPDHPVNCVDWKQAAAYCKWADKRLPTEAEWEYAARGTDGRAYPWGNEDPDAKRMNGSGSEDGWKATAPVGKFPAGASPFGALDMAGTCPSGRPTGLAITRRRP
jgi:formylglycine-generating enzyme required for sulfatase activity